MRKSFYAIGLDRDLEVIGSRRVEPRSFVWFGKARFVLELPDSADLPKQGSRLFVSHV